MDYQTMYAQKLRTAEDAVKIVKDGDWVDYSQTCSFPQALDAALAKRSGELHDVKIRNAISMFPVQTVENDPHGSFTYNLWHCSGLDRRDAALASRLCYGVLQNRMLLDFYIAAFLKGKLRDLQPVVLDILRLGDWLRLDASLGAMRARNVQHLTASDEFSHYETDLPYAAFTDADGNFRDMSGYFISPAMLEKVRNLGGIDLGGERLDAAFQVLHHLFQFLYFLF